jgi:nanoRNase/pAp phosphatase (c-di-AMP/oligoRNAs hydrolase)
MVGMGSDTSVFIKVKTEEQALAVATALRAFGLQVRAPSNSPAISGDGRWIIRAESAEPQREQRHEGCTCTQPQRAS